MVGLTYLRLDSVLFYSRMLQHYRYFKESENKSILVLCDKDSAITEETTDWPLLTGNSLFLNVRGRPLAFLDLPLERYLNRIQFFFGREVFAKVRDPCAYTGTFRAITFGTNSPAGVYCCKLHRIMSVFALKTKLKIFCRNFYLFLLLFLMVSWNWKSHFSST